MSSNYRIIERSSSLATPCQGFRNAACATRRAHLARASSSATAVSGRQLLDDLASAGLSPCRFVVVGNGCILESVGDWSPVRYTTRPTGIIATVSNADKSFEAHFVLSKLSEAHFALVEKPGAPEPLRVVRLVNRDGAAAMSVMLHQPGDAQKAAYDALRERYGDAAALDSEAAGDAQGS